MIKTEELKSKIIVSQNQFVSKSLNDKELFAPQSANKEPEGMSPLPVRVSSGSPNHTSGDALQGTPQCAIEDKKVVGKDD